MFYKIEIIPFLFVKKENLNNENSQGEFDNKGWNLSLSLRWYIKLFSNSQRKQNKMKIKV